jgi:hypothetical protein
MEEQKVCMIQRQFRTNQIKKAIKTLNYGKHTIENNTFEEFTQKIQDKKVLSLVHYILKKITRISNYGKENALTSQDFLSAFVIFGYTEDIIEKPLITAQSDIDKIIIRIAQTIVNKFDTFLNKKIKIRDIQRFHKLLILYKKRFDIWKRKDHKQFVHELTVTYYELEITINEIQEKAAEKETETEGGEDSDTKLLIEYFLERQEDIVNKLIYLGGQDYFHNYKHEEIMLDEGFRRYIKDTLHTAFWDILQTELDETPPKYDKVIMLLTELRDTFCDFVPNRKDVQQEIHENIDIELIKNMVNNDAFDDENLYKLTVYIISLIKRFQPPVMDEKVNEWEKGMLEQFKSKFNYSNFLVVFFNSVFNMVANIVMYSRKFLDEYENRENGENSEKEENVDNVKIAKIE